MAEVLPQAILGYGLLLTRQQNLQTAMLGSAPVTPPAVFTSGQFMPQGAAYTVAPIDSLIIDALVDTTLDVGAEIVIQVVASGGVVPYTWSAMNLPSGLVIDSATGIISGIPRAAGVVTSQIVVTDARGEPAIRAVTFTLVALIVTNATLPAGDVGVAYTGPAMAATGGTPPYAWSATGLPAGFTMNASTGVITGTAASFGTHPLVITATDAVGTTDVQLETLVMGSPPAPTVLAYTGAYQDVVVPAGAQAAAMTVHGAAGGLSGTSQPGGFGGTVVCDVAVTPGETLRVFVGGVGLPPVGGNGGAAGGWNGGGSSQGGAASGGGGSDVRRAPYALADRLVIGGGGGGGGWAYYGGAGGTPNGLSHPTWPSAGGTQTAGGTPNGDGGAGALGQGGAGAWYAGGGGGGFYGGAGGYSNYNNGGGGGSGKSTGVNETLSSAHAGAGAVTLTWK